MRPFRVLPLLLCLAALPARAQYVVKKVVFIGAAPYEEADLQAIAALPAGTALSKADMKTVTQRIVDTGYFDDVQNTLDGPFKAVEVRFKVKPTDQTKLMRAGFENIVWMQPEELSAALAAKLPLFAHGLPEAGQTQARVDAALTEILAAKGVTATVSHAIVEPSTGHPLRVVEYKVESPAVVLHGAHLSGVATEMVPAIRAALTRNNGTRYNEGLAGVTSAARLLQPYSDLGYIDARLDHLTRAVVPGADEKHVQVDITAAVVAGDAYKVSALNYAGTPVVSAEDFAKTVKLKPGDIASGKALFASLAPVTVAYHGKGYMDAVVDATPVEDAATHQVAYTVTVIPGDVYKLRNITVKGLTPELTAKFNSLFQLHSGDVYSETAVTGFFKQHIANPPFQGYGGAYDAVADPDTHLLDLTVTFFHN
ncbi:outer membrane protein insertion porin family [Granulicella rosea]|uniref:Outer membrane protein insertion porin family n=1 Tax=Granulicella rosea TaxID=474952 RepID=A0A239DYB1_9BACT|nr:POTRA domain-containing protein [Granulicella rosea]SNS37460.1 outer membrane protein insertion porin family [Granulicella rosea]